MKERTSSIPGESAIRGRLQSSTAKSLVPWLVAFAFFMESMDTTILNTAIPVIAEALHVTVLNMKAVMASYTLSLAVFIPISGWVADRFGTRRVFASAIGVFTLGSVLCGISINIHVLVLCRVLQGLGGSMMVPVGRLTLVRAFEKSQLVHTVSFVTIPALIGPMLGPVMGGLIVRYLHWRYIFFLNLPIGVLGLVMVFLHLPDYKEKRTHPLDAVGLVLFGTGIALLSYVLEIFGEHLLGPWEIACLLILSFALIGAYARHGTQTQHPMLNLRLFRIRTFRVAVSGSFFTRLGIGGVPFLLPLLYQVGLGFNPVQSGLLVMPQAIASMGMTVLLQKLLTQVGYRGVLVSNTVLIGLLLASFATIGIHTPVWRIVLLAFLYGGCTSLQYTSMNTLVYADTNDQETSNASSIASTVQQMSVSFGVAITGLATAFFLPTSTGSNRVSFIHGLHMALIALGALTIATTVIFGRLRKDDGNVVSHQEVVHAL
jgi:EmrB/QacA subfamily drug resistance transporter